MGTKHEAVFAAATRDDWPRVATLLANYQGWELYRLTDVLAGIEQAAIAAAGADALKRRLLVPAPQPGES